MSEAGKSFIDGLAGERICGRYIVERIIGSGGMGFVAVARYPELEQQVAIKFMRPEHAANATLCARFLKEARLAAKVTSLHFVRVFDLGRLDSGVPFLVMELLSGRDLGDELAARGALPAPEAIDYVLQALSGIAEVHALGVVHRDLKPSNLFLAEAAGMRTLKVLDFGISKSTKEGGAGLTSTENMLGTPHYMSPEQIKESKTVDMRSDIWSLGVILYELLTNTLPFVAEEGSAGELFGKILFTDPVPPTQTCPDMPPDLEQVILRCLQREPRDRFANVGELAEALRPFAMPTSEHRVQVAQRALSGARVADAPPPEESGPPGSTAHSSPVAKRPAAEKVTSGPAVALTEPAPPLVPVTAMTSTRSSARPAHARRNAGVMAIGAIALVVGATGAFFLVTRTPPSGGGQPQRASAESTTSTPPALPAAIAPALAPQTLPPPASATPIASAAATIPVASVARKSIAAARPAASAAPSPHAAGAGDILLDRK